MIADIGRHLALGDAPHLAFTAIASSGHTMPPSPLFLLGPTNPVVHDELFGQTELAEVGTYTLTDAVLAPSGIAIKDGVAFNSTAFIHPAHHVQAVAGRLLAADLPVRRVRGTLAVIYGPGHQTYGHWLVDFLPRLWILASCGHDLATLKYAVPPELTPATRRLLAQLGIRKTQLVSCRYWREILHVEHLLMPTGLRALNRLHPHFAPATAFWTARLNRTTSPEAAAPTHLFVSRAKVVGSRILDNRGRIEAIASQRGFTIVHPQTMTLGEQAALFSTARVIVGEYGSGLHGSVHAPPGTLTIGLRGTARHPSFVQSGVAHALGQHAAYVFGATTLGHTDGEVGQVFTIEPEDFERALDIAAALEPDPA